MVAGEFGEELNMLSMAVRYSADDIKELLLGEEIHRRLLEHNCMDPTTNTGHLVATYLQLSRP